MIAALMPPADSVLMVVPRWVRDGGVAAHIAASAQALAERGARVSLLVARIETDFTPPGVRLFHSPQLFKSDAPMAQRIGDALSCEPSVIHLNQLGDPAVVGFLREHAPVVISAHGYLACTAGVHYFRPGQECTRAHGPGCVPNLVRCAHTRHPRTLPGAYRGATRELAALVDADLAISYSSAVDRHLATNGVQRRRVVPYFPTVTPATRTVAPQERRVVFAGRIVAPKGLATLVRAMREVAGELIVCGDGWQLPAMRRLARRLRVSERVRFRGWLEPDALAQELADASVVVVPSLWPEPFGIVGIEAFAAGRPAVASAVGGVGDWLENGISGLTVPAGDARALARALNELLEDPQRQAQMGAAGRASVQARFSLEHHLAAISEAYAAARETWLSRSGEAREQRSLAASGARG
jgi:glycosyltransferase involved in cell wall biosynthesis